MQTIDALDNWEDLTELGHHLVDLPVKPRLGKMVLHSVVLKCLDPILTIVCALAYRDPCKWQIYHVQALNVNKILHFLLVMLIDLSLLQGFE